MGGLTQALGMTEMEKAEFNLARQKLYEKLVEMTGQVEDAIEDAKKSDEIYGVNDMIYGLSVDQIAKAFAETNKPVIAAAKRMKTEPGS